MRADAASSHISVVIPSLNREKELAHAIQSLDDPHLTIQWIILRNRGPLAALRNYGLAQARSPVVCFTDDDIVASPDYLRRVLWHLGQPGRYGVTGPSRIPPSFLRHRELFRNDWLLYLYERCFVLPESRPGQLTRAGTFVPRPTWTYEGPVQFLEACHMSFQTHALKAIGGFDEDYSGIGDWSEPDLAFRLRKCFGECLWFDPRLAVEHRCAVGGAIVLRVGDASQRLANYKRFAHRWVTPTVRHQLYRIFLTSYYRGYQSWCQLKR